ncbi:DUF2478 domain-containing protein [Shimia thalassica]|uniref:DUF2478 domain-containing protein n=1 Tax=Shimia thalassica TaxID=1715693 RepID=UPI000C070020|nr:DUF2478 domain-containing protein [Shimia thalassica]PHO02493.1 3-dehydroquinate dehydratase [Rhodobacteraceae bacterium 4F10]MDO6479969.1 DUF2478 domain-containing protein [Shimia thalassica]MDO6483229.1 DUF2478 domain-containing protein [Shimia thalassica]MDO6520905.1 DUF2478 domain-containing protein [Shimia thalassica]MDP2517720.1 DUF2478 domain-containing protein [Shimia thalassica]
MKIAYTLAPGRGETNLVLLELAKDLEKSGKRLCGTVQVDTEREKDHHCDMDVLVLPDGPTIRISQSLGRESRGCRLNPDALENAVGLTEAELEKDVDVLIVNKFGKHEADGRGFRGAIARALEKDVPVLVGANKLNLDALRSFCADEVEELAPDLETLRAWVVSA